MGATRVGLVEWLANLGLERYAATFMEHEIGFSALPTLTETDLISIGIFGVSGLPSVFLYWRVALRRGGVTSMKVADNALRRCFRVVCFCCVVSAEVSVRV